MNETSRGALDRPPVSPRTQFTKGSPTAAAAARQKTKHQTQMTMTVKQSIALTFEKLGGVNGYAKWAAKNPDKFYEHWIKILPVEIKAEVNVTTDFASILEQARGRIAYTKAEADAAEVIEPAANSPDVKKV